MTTLSERLPGYDQALSTAALADEGASGRIYMHGRDRAELLQRLSTNDLLPLKPGQGAQTVLTTPIGRIIDLLTIHALDEALLLVTSPGQGPAVYGHLKQNIFFNDQVTLEPAGRALSQLALYGPQAGSLLADLGGGAPAGLALHATAELIIAGAAVRVARRRPIGGDGYTLYIPAAEAPAVRAALEAAGAAPLDEHSFEALRVEAGIPAFGRELSQEYIPLETGLVDAISFTKGCYVGQEIIARMESRGRLAKQMRGLRLSAPGGEAGASIAAPSKLSVAGKEAGDLTSVVLSPRLGPIALAYVRSAHAEPGTVVGIEGSDLVGEVVELPFSFH
jgi:folate-binding protein YgfZ